MDPPGSPGGGDSPGAVGQHESPGGGSPPDSVESVVCEFRGRLGSDESQAGSGDSSSYDGGSPPATPPRSPRSAESAEDLDGISPESLERALLGSESVGNEPEASVGTSSPAGTPTEHLAPLVSCLTTATSSR
ncbi:hypothetical protein PR002_g4488 [Phytophthora rubi]|uniref:Uncharacterized protein n=1 Tax=Phytophthora rubi TaxID=129364 RepID=A0A6A3ND97_9STRA|nr:hypothetical protein PR002_g4488 [Phytophthora rubi]